ncbi:MAG: hypothetical protein JXB88_16335 [Spirochaetales bacterium]|nr:hypothetical protein [Spirochaetales bacterium]
MHHYICTYCGLNISGKENSCPACGHSDFKKISEPVSSFREYYHELSDRALLNINPEDLRSDALILYNREMKSRGIYPVKKEITRKKKFISPFHWTLIYPGIAIILFGLIILLIMYTC